MQLGGFVPCSLSDYPGKVSAVLFTQGCNFRCPYCHNGHLISRKRHANGATSTASVLSTLSARRGLLDGVVVTGGEPTLHDDVADLLGRLKAMGLAVKLDTNGSAPLVLRSVLENRLVDYVAMDIKAPLPLYSRLAGVAVSTEAVLASIGCIAQSGVEHEFRTVHVAPLLGSEDLAAIAAMVPSSSRHRILPFSPELARDPALRSATRRSNRALKPLLDFEATNDVPQAVGEAI